MWVGAHLVMHNFILVFWTVWQCLDGGWAFMFCEKVPKLKLLNFPWCYPDSQSLSRKEKMFILFNMMPLHLSLFRGKFMEED